MYIVCYTLRVRLKDTVMQLHGTQTMAMCTILYVHRHNTAQHMQYGSDDSLGPGLLLIIACKTRRQGLLIAPHVAMDSKEVTSFLL